MPCGKRVVGPTADPCPPGLTCGNSQLLATERGGGNGGVLSSPVKGPLGLVCGARHRALLKGRADLSRRITFRGRRAARGPAQGGRGRTQKDRQAGRRRPRPTERRHRRPRARRRPARRAAQTPVAGLHVLWAAAPREPGLCRQCGGPHEGSADQREQQIAAARAKVEQLRLRLRTLEEAALAAAAEAAKADTAAAEVLAARDAYDEGHLQPARKTAQQAEKEAHGLSRYVAQLKKRLESADYISAQEKAIQTAKEQMEAAQAARDAAVTATTCAANRSPHAGRSSSSPGCSRSTPTSRPPSSTPATSPPASRSATRPSPRARSPAARRWPPTSRCSQLCATSAASTPPSESPAADHRLAPGRPRSTGTGPRHRTASDRHPDRHRRRRLTRRLRLPGHRRHQRPAPPPLPGRTGNPYRHRQPVLRPRTLPRPLRPALCGTAGRKQPQGSWHARSCARASALGIAFQPGSRKEST